MQLFFLVINIALLIFVWEFLWKKFLLNLTKSRIIDLRYELRKWYTSKNISLTSEEYIIMDSRLKTSMLSVDEVTLSYLRTIHKLVEKEILKGKDIKTLEKITHMKDNDTSQFNKKIIHETFMALIRLAVMRSFVCTVVIVLATPFIAIFTCAKSLKEHCKFAKSQTTVLQKVFVSLHIICGVILNFPNTRMTNACTMDNSFSSSSILAGMQLATKRR